MVASPENFFPHFLQKCCLFWKKLLNEKIFKTLFPIKKGYIHFPRQTPLPFKRDLAARNGFPLFSQKMQLFLKKLLNNNLFNTSLVMNTKVMLIFGPKRLLSLKSCQMCFQNSFSRFFQKILLFFEKIFSILFLIKEVIFIFAVRWSLTGRTVTQRPCCRQSREAPFNPYFYVPK